MGYGGKMVYIIVGKINEGKTTKLLSLYKEREKGDGFIIKKIYIGDIYVGQEIMRLSTGESMAFSYKEGFVPVHWWESEKFSTYSFSVEGLKFAENIVLGIEENNIEPVFIDEIGPLELQQKGFYKLLIRLLQKDKEIYITVRENCVKEVIEKFNIKIYKIINI